MRRALSPFLAAVLLCLAFASAVFSTDTASPSRIPSTLPKKTEKGSDSPFGLRERVSLQCLIRGRLIDGKVVTADNMSSGQSATDIEQEGIEVETWAPFPNCLNNNMPLRTFMATNMEYTCTLPASFFENGFARCRVATTNRGRRYIPLTIPFWPVYQRMTPAAVHALGLRLDVYGFVDTTSLSPALQATVRSMPLPPRLVPVDTYVGNHINFIMHMSHPDMLGGNDGETFSGGFSLMHLLGRHIVAATAYPVRDQFRRVVSGSLVDVMTGSVFHKGVAVENAFVDMHGVVIWSEGENFEPERIPKSALNVFINAIVVFVLVFVALGGMFAVYFVLVVSPSVHQAILQEKEANRSLITGASQGPLGAAAPGGGPPAGSSKTSLAEKLA
ncbi:hypothetical protein H696_00731 [Fonticula alba]|uniref:Uncharacterized protein n=1 Tax=Fonticula alba TaxID=691883 RepID=A0A058ZGX6_FONAL|nr:hypothetical protein H696_00731 [Fonticula alba]KCV73188.1 hypothetical protein H696_00731 [Fonticula alba]|eukprot:XP_009492889.1 hypothetical protein H696_00731 [Fonticula alba]